MSTARACSPPIFALAFLAGCNKQADQPPPPPPPPQVEVVEVTPRDVPIQSEWIATLDGTNNAVITAQVTGYLMHQKYDEGSLVHKGDVLFEIDDRTFKAAVEKANGDLSRAQAALGKASLDVERYTPLAAASAISQQELDDAKQAKAAAEAAVVSAQALIDQAQLSLEFTKMTSPIEGIAGLAKVSIGDLVGPSTGALTTVSTVNPIRAYLLLREQDYLMHMREAEEMSREAKDKRRSNFELILSTGETFPEKGKFLFIDRNVNIRTGTLMVAIEFPNPGNMLRPGQYARVRANLKHKAGALLVPQRAVGDRQGIQMVAVVGPDSKVELKPVKTAERVGSDWIISEGLKPGDRVIAEGLQKVRPGTQVETKPYAGSRTAKPQPAAPSPETSVGSR